MKRQLFMLAFLAISFAACKKDNGQVNNKAESEPKNSTASRTAVAASVPDNPLNPYDSTGYWHNVVVSYIQKCTQADTPDVFSATQCVIRFYRENIGEEIPASFFETVGQTVDRSTKDMDALIVSCPYDEPVKEALKALMQLLRKLSDDDSGYDTIKATIMGFEQRVIQNKQLTDEGKAVILKASSVARYSTYYWINFNRPQPGAAMKWKNIVKWIAAVTSDIAGEVVSGNIGYAADCSSYAYDLVTYSMP